MLFGSTDQLRSFLESVRGRFKLLKYEPIDGGAQLTFEVLMEREGSDKPVCIAESVGRRFV